MAQVQWLDQALKNVEDIVAYIAKDKIDRDAIEVCAFAQNFVVEDADLMAKGDEASSEVDSNEATPTCNQKFHQVIVLNARTWHYPKGLLDWSFLMRPATELQLANANISGTMP